MKEEDKEEKLEVLRETLTKLKEENDKQPLSPGLRADPVRALARRLIILEDKVAAIEQRINQLGIDVLLN